VSNLPGFPPRCAALRQPIWRWLTIALTVATACSPLRRVHECGPVIEMLNDSLRALAPQLATAGPSPTAYARIADGYAELDAKLQATHPRDASLLKLVASYRDLTQRATKHSRAFAEELAKPTGSADEEKERGARLDRLRTQAKGEQAKEAALVRKLNTLCHPQ